jgi:hypothetical protein
MRIALELSEHNHVYEDIATKFFEHFLGIAAAMSSMVSDDVGLWDDEDKFFYDVLCLPNNQRMRLRIRSMVGLIPLFAVETLEPEMLDRLPAFRKRLEWFLMHRPDLANLVSHWQSPGRGERRLLSLLRGHRMKMLLKRMLDETEFLSDYGVRALSKWHLEHPFELKVGHFDESVRYSPAESETRQFGGNSNWRGPIWFPVNFLVIESLQKFHHYYGKDFKVECPTGSGKFLTLQEVATELSHRLARIFLKDEKGERPVLRHQPQLQFVSTSTSTATPAGASGPRINPDGPPSSPSCSCRERRSKRGGLDKPRGALDTRKSRPANPLERWKGPSDADDNDIGRSTSTRI